MGCPLQIVGLPPLILTYRSKLILDTRQTSHNGKTLSNLEHNVSRKSIHTFFWDYAEDIAHEHGIPLHELILGLFFLCKTLRPFTCLRLVVEHWYCAKAHVVDPAEWVSGSVGSHLGEAHLPLALVAEGYRNQ